MSTTVTPDVEPRVPGWDSKVRRRVRMEVGGIRALADEVGVTHSPIERPMKVWGRLVEHFAGTAGVEDYLNGRDPA